MSNIVKSKFAGLLRGLLRRFDERGGATTVAPQRPMAASAASRTTYPRASSPAAAPQSKPQSTFTPPPGASTSGLQLPLPPIIAGLPMDLRARLMRTPPANAIVSIPVETVLSQLAHGSVKMTFGELRAAMPGLFASYGNENDGRQIVLPLNEIISRLNPALLSRRIVKKVEPADDISEPFGARSQSAHFTPPQVPAGAAPMSASRLPEPQPAPAASTFIPPPTFSVRKTTATAPRPAPVKPVVSAPPAAPAAPIPFSPAPAAAAAGGLNSAPQIPAANPILVPMSALAEKWPDAIKMELVQAGLIGAQAELPAALVETGLKRGRVTVMWKNLRTIIRPKPAPVSIHDGVEIELPLKVLAPIFFESQKAAGLVKQKVSVSEEIPDLFHSSKQAGAAIPFMPAPAFTPATAPVSLAPATPAASVSFAPVKPVISAPPAALVASAAASQEVISAPLDMLSEKWPEALRQEITGWKLANAQVALPLDALAPAMKRGRVMFVWRDLRSWIRPAPAATASAHDGAELELPLKVIAPLFLERQAPAARPQPKVTIDTAIPIPFSSVASPEMVMPLVAPAPTPLVAPAPTPLVAPAPKPARPALKPVDAQISETNFYVWGDDGEAPHVDETEYKRRQTPATDFTSRCASPKETVERAIALPGVAGALVALYDGLMIAGQLPPELNGDTVAAFLPQIFSRTSQSTKELRMGELNNLSFTVGNVPWKIYRVNSVYFAAFGRAGEPLPTAQLAALAGQLDRKKQ